ncbi:copper amine oxidase N-terminal domain-containing protein [Paenibacillus jiagnxiensis]|uniref:copper amine oxidase N-terminal domain-containing protein n=1 Tax=Paenibacillus jiagnxiensis TaxID=3228926 RepID=UPI0033AB5962
MSKKFLYSALLLTVLLPFWLTGHAWAGKSYPFTVNGVEVDAGGNAPFMDDTLGAIYVPSQFFSKHLNAQVKWDALTKSVIIQNEDTAAEIRFKVNEKAITVKGTAKPLSTPAVIRNGQDGRPATMVPLRATLEGMGASLSWAKSNTVLAIKTPWRIPELETDVNAWEPYGVQKEIAPALFNGIKYKDGTLKLNIPQIPGKTVEALLIDGADASKAPEEIKQGKTYSFNTRDFSLSIRVKMPKADDRTQSVVYDSYEIYTISAAKRISENYIEGDLTVVDRYQHYIPLTRVYEALGIKL